MDAIYLLQHSYEDGNDVEHTKTLGVYASKNEAKAAVERYRRVEGFSATPNGFDIARWKVGEESWKEGFFAYTYPTRSPEQVLKEFCDDGGSYEIDVAQDGVTISGSANMSVMLMALVGAAMNHDRTIRLPLSSQNDVAPVVTITIKEA